MATLEVGFPGDYSATRQKAIEEARTVQVLVAKECAEAGEEAPPYELSELIGKGSFGRVYKATSTRSRQAVAIKIISIDEGDSFHPGASDTFSDILKEVNTLKLLSESGAKNINTVIDTLLVGPTIWIITEYCAGGSVATLMRPTGGLAEKWIIPILREVAEAIYWVHKQGIIHRDIKCANVLVTEAGGVQLCDFGVAGIIETKFDKRSTVTGTLQWMAPELFDSTVSYGSEVDIWAFGSMAYEIATGLPPNAGPIADFSQFGSYLKQHCPRLTGDQYSSHLKDLVAFCMVEDPAQRPPIEQVQRHPYIYNTSEDYPTVSLSKLVHAYKVWEIQGGSRRSLFSAGGAQGPASEYSPPSIADNEWNFSATDEEIDFDDSDAQVVHDVYGSNVDFPPRHDSTSRWQSRRRRPPNIKAFKVPLEKVFDPNTISNYDDNARAFYGRAGPASTTDLPLRNNSEPPTIRESLIDLDMSLNGGELSQFADLETIKAGPRPATSNLEDRNRRRTQDWTFPSMAPASAGLDMPTLEPNHESLNFAQDASPFNLQSSGESVGHTAPNAELNRFSAVSLIDLDAGLATDMADVARPSTAGSDALSTGSEKPPFDLERHRFESEPEFVSSTREPSIYVSDDVYSGEPLPADHDSGFPTQRMVLESRTDRNRLPSLAPPPCHVPLPPSSYVMQGLSSPEETKDELRRLISSFHEHLQFTSFVLETLPVCDKGHYTLDSSP
ncbi:hypothetical protein VTK56DRAFT_5961 [Thermocarpiscus australiensis]